MLICLRVICFTTPHRIRKSLPSWAPWTVLITIPILTKTLLFDGNFFHIKTITNILNATMNLVHLLKDLANRFFNQFTDSCRHEDINKKLNESVSIWPIIISNLLLLAYFLMFLDNFFFYFQRLFVCFGNLWLPLLLLQCTRFILFIYQKKESLLMT